MARCLQHVTTSRCASGKQPSNSSFSPFPCPTKWIAWHFLPTASYLPSLALKRKSRNARRPDRQFDSFGETRSSRRCQEKQCSLHRLGVWQRTTTFPEMTRQVVGHRCQSRNEQYGIACGWVNGRHGGRTPSITMTTIAPARLAVRSPGGLCRTEEARRWQR